MATPDAAAGRPAFVGSPLRHVPVPAADLWREDEFGAELLSQYHERVRRDYDNNPALRVFKVAAGIVHGSNPFAVCLVDMIVRPKVRVATPVDLQAVVDSEGKAAEPVKLRGTYHDMALVLRSVRDPNGYLAQRLNEQVGLKTSLPALVFLSGLRLVNDPDSPYGLSFRLTEHSQVVSAPVLKEKSGHFDNSVVDRKTGLPSRIEGSQRYYYGGEDGLTRLYLGRGYALDTIWDELVNSQPDGRVVLVDNEVPAVSVSQYLERLDEATDLLQP
jgi:hypothetical protein